MKKLKNKDDMRCKERPALNICKMYRAPRARSLCPLVFVLGRFAKNAVLELHEPQQSRMLRGYLQYKILRKQQADITTFVSHYKKARVGWFLARLLRA
jgi:hypothetical protein